MYLQNVEKKEGEKWRYVGDGIYERTYMAYQEGETLTSFMEIKGWRIYGQPSYTILPFVEVELSLIHIYRAGRHGGDLSHQPDRRNQCDHRQYQQQQPEPERDVCRRDVYKRQLLMFDISCFAYKNV